MQPTQTGIATALALVVVIAFFIIPGLWPFREAASTAAPSAAATTATTSPITMPSEPITKLSAQDVAVGTGPAAARGDRVTVTYVGSLTNGTIFDASANHAQTASGFTFTLGAGQVIKGWDEGIVGMKVGGKRILYIPASLAYGSQAVGNVIPANSPLVFQVELLKVEKPTR